MDFVKNHQKGEIVFPSEMSRRLRITVQGAYERLHESKDVRPFYVLRCPSCTHIAGETRYYSVTEFPIGEKVRCMHCGEPFVPYAEDTIVLFERI